MSIQAMKRKAVINYGSNRSGKPPGGLWVKQGPFGSSSTINVVAPGPVGFSINGGTRNVGYIGKSSHFSKQGTPYNGQFPRGWGGCCGTYKLAEPFFNSSEVNVLGNQFEYIKPSVLSTKGMLEKKYRWIHTGQYPNNWVQNTYTGNQVDSASQWLYIQQKAAQNTCVNNTNKPNQFENYYHIGSPTGCANTMAKLDYKIVSSNMGYTKDLYIPQTASQYTLQVQRKCANPTSLQKPFPFNTPSASSNSGNGINYAPPAIFKIDYLTPPLWYTSTQKL